MATGIEVLSRTQIVFVEPSSGSVAVINSGPPGSVGPPGVDSPAETRVRGTIVCVGAVSATTVGVSFPVVFDGKPVVIFWAEIASNTLVTWEAEVRGWDETGGEYSGVDIRYSSAATVDIYFAIQGPEVV